MIKLIGETIQNKVLAIWLIAATLLLCVFSVTYKVGDEIVERYSIFETETIEGIEAEISEAKADLASMLESGEYYQPIVDNLRQEIIVLEELKAQKATIDYKSVYQGPETAREGKHAFVFESLPLFLGLSLASSIVIIWVVITREFDEGVYVHIYNKNRTSNYLKRVAVVLMTTSVLFFGGAAIVYVFAGMYPDTFKLGLLVSECKAYFMEIGKYTFVYGVLRTYYIVMFATVVFVLIALLLKKTLPTVVASALLTAGVWFLARTNPEIASLIGIGSLETMVYYPKSYFDWSPLYVLVPAVLLVAMLRLYFEKRDIN